jgi:predicted RNA methylase
MANHVPEAVTLGEVRAHLSQTILLSETTAAQHQALFRRALASRDSLSAELNKLQKMPLARLAGLRASDYTKEKLAKYALDELLEAFSLGKAMAGGISSSVLCTPGGMLKLITEKVETLIDADLVEYRERVAESRAARAEEADEHQRRLADPQTDDDFESFIWHHGVRALAALKAEKRAPRKQNEQQAIIRREGLRAMNDEQLARYDELQAAKARERRSAEMVARSTVRRIEIGEGNYMEVLKWWHTKRECDTWLVVLAEREDRTTFEELCIAAGKLSGGYQRAWGDRPGGFQFFAQEQAEKFVQLQSRDVFEMSRLERLVGRRDRVRSNAVTHFETLGDRMEGRAHDSLDRPRLENTERRIMLAERARDVAHEDIAMADTLRSMATALRARLALHTDRIRWRTHAEAFDDILAASGGRMASVEYPWPRLGVHSLKEIAAQIQDQEGSILVTRRVLKMCEEQGAGVVVFRGSGAADTLRHFYRRARLHRVRGWALDSVRHALGHFKRCRLMNLDSLPELRAALREYQGHRQRPDTMSMAEKVMHDLYSGQFPPDYFPTPRDVVELMLEYADFEDGFDWLEPSAGSGHIANVVRELYPHARATLCEWSGLLCRALEAQGWVPVKADFISCRWSGFDRVLMNPPFGANGVGTDIDHVRHAYTMLKPGGRLVSLMSDGVFYRGDHKAQEFRAWLDSLDGSSFELPEGAFLNSDRPTSWAARVVVVDRPLDDVPAEASAFVEAFEPLRIPVAV